MATLVKISINDKIALVLERVQGEYPTLSTTEIFKLGLAELDRKTELERRKRWSESLPLLEASVEDEASIAEARDELKVSERERMTAEELISSLAEV